MNRVVIWSQLSVLFLGLLPACGSDSGGSASSPSDLIPACVSWCKNEETCDSTTSTLFGDCSTYCNNESNHVTSSCDLSKLKAQLNTCATTACAQLTACTEQIASICPINDSGSGGSANGSGGSPSGSGGTPSGTGGSATSGDPCAACTNAPACCIAIAGSASGAAAACQSYSKDKCTAETGSAQTQQGQLCSAFVSAGKAQNIAACQ